MGYKNRNEYLPCKYWIKDNRLYRAFYEYEEDCYDSPRDWGNLGIIVNFSDYCLTGSGDEKVRNMTAEEWLIAETGINEDWYESHRESYGIDGLLNKFIKEKCAAFQYLSVYDHSGVTVSCGRAYGWDYSNVGFIYVSKDNKELNSTFKNPNSKKAKEWAENIIKGELQILDDYVRGNVYCLVCEVYDEESGEWEIEDTLGCIYLTSDTFEEEKKMAIDEIKYNMAGKCELIDEDIAKKAIENHTIDVLCGQKVFEFMKIA